MEKEKRSVVVDTHTENVRTKWGKNANIKHGRENIACSWHVEFPNAYPMKLFSTVDGLHMWFHEQKKEGEDPKNAIRYRRVQKANAHPMKSKRKKNKKCLVRHRFITHQPRGGKTYVRTDGGDWKSSTYVCMGECYRLLEAAMSFRMHPRWILLMVYVKSITRTQAKGEEIPKMLNKTGAKRKKRMGKEISPFCANTT